MVIEPTPLNQVLRRTLPPAVDVVAAAASDRCGEAELWLPPADPVTLDDQGAPNGGTARGGTADGGRGGVSSLHRRDIHGTSVTVPLLTVDGLGLRDVTFMKIDVDGHEVAVLRGAEKTIRRDQPRLLVEVEQRIQLVTDVTGLLESWGYRGWVLPGRHWVPISASPSRRTRPGRRTCPNAGCWPGCCGRFRAT